MIPFAIPPAAPARCAGPPLPRRHARRPVPKHRRREFFFCRASASLGWSPCSPAPVDIRAAAIASMSSAAARLAGARRRLEPVVQADGGRGVPQADAHVDAAGHRVNPRPRDAGAPTTRRCCCGAGGGGRAACARVAPLPCVSRVNARKPQPRRLLRHRRRLPRGSAAMLRPRACGSGASGLADSLRPWPRGNAIGGARRSRSSPRPPSSRPVLCPAGDRLRRRRAAAALRRRRPAGGGGARRRGAAGHLPLRRRLLSRARRPAAPRSRRARPDGRRAARLGDRRAALLGPSPARGALAVRLAHPRKRGARHGHALRSAALPGCARDVQPALGAASAGVERSAPADVGRRARGRPAAARSRGVVRGRATVFLAELRRRVLRAGDAVLGRRRVCRAALREQRAGARLRPALRTRADPSLSRDAQGGFRMSASRDGAGLRPRAASRRLRHRRGGGACTWNAATGERACRRR